MASTYTQNTGIEKPGTGDKSGTWGVTTNTNFDIIDRALNGVGVITLSGTSHSLTTSDGTLSDGHYKILVLGGSPSGTNTITISPNDQAKIFFVKNTTAQSAVFTQGSGGNVTVASGESKIIYADGAGASAVVTDFTNTLATAGNINATTFSINGTPVTATASDLNKLNGATASTTEINHLAGVTSGIQSQLNTLQSNISSVNTDLSNDSSPELSGDLDCNQYDIILPNSTGAADASRLCFGSKLGGYSPWEIYRDNQNRICFAYNTSVVLRLDTNGELRSENNIVAYASL